MRLYAREIGFTDQIGRGARDVLHFWPIYGHADTCRPVSRACCSLAYGVGFICLAIVVYQNIVGVINAAW